MNSPLLPRRISSQSITLQTFGQETLVYDQDRHQALCLNSISACVWRHCDGQMTVEQIATAAASELNAPVTAQVVLDTLGELRAKNLLDPDTLPAQSDSVTRRAMIGRTGLAAAALLPVVTSIFAQPASAQSGSFTGMSRPEGAAE